MTSNFKRKNNGKLNYAKKEKKNPLFLILIFFSLPYENIQTLKQNNFFFYYLNAVFIN